MFQDSQKTLIVGDDVILFGRGLIFVLQGGHTQIYTQIDTQMDTNLQGGTLSLGSQETGAKRLPWSQQTEFCVITYAFESRSGRKVCGTCFLYGAI